MDLGTLISLLRVYKYAAMFGVLFFSGMGLPVPEEVTLLASGLAVGWEEADFLVALVTCVLGILAADSLLFAMGRYCGPWFLSLKPVGWVLTERRQARIQRLFDEHGSKAILTARFFVGVRLGIYAYAGQSGISWARFLFLDLLSTLMTGPLTLLVGAYAASKLTNPHRAIQLAGELLHQGSFWLYGALALSLFVVISRWAWRRQRRNGFARV